MSHTTAEIAVGDHRDGDGAGAAPIGAGRAA